ncbi:hypothetical protein PG984_016154, partial [Apiospora sp. TS-2023a]
RVPLLTVAVVGDSGVGKTALVERFCCNAFWNPCLTSADLYMMNAQVDGFDSVKKNVYFDKNKYTTEIMDTTAWKQEEWSQLDEFDKRKLDLQSCGGFILAFSTTSRTSFDHVRRIHRSLQEIKGLSVSGNSTSERPTATPVAIVLVGTKTDLVAEREVSEHEGRALAHSLGGPYFDVSANHGDGVNVCFLELFRVLGRSGGDSEVTERGDARSHARQRTQPPAVLLRSRLSAFNLARSGAVGRSQIANPSPKSRSHKTSATDSGGNRMRVPYTPRRFDHMMLRYLPETTSSNRDRATTCFISTLNQWMQLGGTYQQRIEDYALRDLTQELQHVSPGKLYVADIYSQPGPSLLGGVQHWVETTTAVRWDWHPLPSHPRELSYTGKEVMLTWICTCGDGRWAIVPGSFLERSLLNHASSSPSTVAVGTAGAASQYGGRVSSQPHDASAALASRNIAKPPDAPTSRLSSGPSATPARPLSGSHSRSATRQAVTPQTWVILLVRRGYNFRLSHLDASVGSCHDFFVTLRTTYFSLRGQLRSWFSVWQYSHCDFYMCEKFEENEFSPTQKDSFPGSTDPCYQFVPRPMDLVPPISKHEFYRRFHSCLETSKRYHLHHTCKVLRGHSYDVLHRLPKRTQELELGGDKRERFWGALFAGGREPAAGPDLQSDLYLACPGVLFCVAFWHQLGHRPPECKCARRCDDHLVVFVLEPISRQPAVRRSQRRETSFCTPRTLCGEGVLSDTIIKDNEGFILAYSITSHSSFAWAKVLYHRFSRVKAWPKKPDPSSIPITLVGTKSVMVTERVVTTEEGEALAESLGVKFSEVSAKDGGAVQEAFHDVFRMVQSQRVSPTGPSPDKPVRQFDLNEIV